MGKDIHIKICKYNIETNLFEKVSLFRLRGEYEQHDYDAEGKSIPVTSPYIEVPVYDGRDSELFEILSAVTLDDDFGYFPSAPISISSLAPDLAKEVREKEKTLGYFDFREINLADMYNYLKDNPTVPDWDNWDEKEDSCKPKENPVSDLFKDICEYIKFTDYFRELAILSRYKIIYWFDC